MREFLRLIESHTPSIQEEGIVITSEEVIPVDEDMVGQRGGGLLNDLEDKLSKRRKDGIKPKTEKRLPSDIQPKDRKLGAELERFMAEENLEEAGGLRTTAAALAITGALAGGAKIGNTMAQHTLAQQAPYAADKVVDGRNVGQGDWQHQYGINEPEQAEKPHSFIDTIKELNPFKQKVDPAQEEAQKAFQRDVNYLAMTIWGEARSQGTEGMNAVGHVIKNRVAKHRWGDNVKDVVLNRKQFSCWNPGDPNREKMQEMRKLEIMIRNKQAPEGKEFEPWMNSLQKSGLYGEYKVWLQAKKIAENIMQDRSEDITNGALFYHTKAIKPDWSVGQQTIADIGSHVFYRKAAQKATPKPKRT